MARGLIAVLSLLAWLVPASAASAATFTVTGFDDPSGATCSGTNCASLRAAVAAADGTTGSSITMAAGTYTLDGAPLTILNVGDLAIAGAGESATAIQQTAAGSGVVTISNPTANVAVSDLTITGGDAVGVSQASAVPPAAGAVGGSAVGGILAQGGLALTRVAVTGNRAVGGNGGSTPTTGTPGAGGSAVGGIEVAGTLTLDHSAVTANTAFGGTGGVSNLADGAAGGAAAAGVQVDAGAGAVTIIGSDLSGNASAGGQGAPSFGSGSSHDGSGGPASGGLVALSAQPVSISGTTINANTATGGTGGEDPTIADPMASPSASVGGNGGAATGGGINATGGAVTVIDASIDGDTVTGGGGGAALHQSGQAGTATGGGIASSAPATLTVRRATIGLDSAAAGAPGPTGGSATTAAGGADAFGGGASVAGAGTIVNVTLAKNQAIGSAGAGPIPASSTPGSPGRGIGGGIVVLPPSGSLVLAADTLSTNAVQEPVGAGAYGANIDAETPPVRVSDTIFDAPVGLNCFILGSNWTDSGHNLESTTPSQCRLTTANNDLVGADPQFGQFADHGGPGPTLAPAPASLARGAGGACTDPSLNGNPLLALDERSTARHASCDIGAYETQPAVATGPVTVSGPALLGRALSCPATSFAGDAPLTFAFTWRRSGAPIAGATGASYTLATADLGQPVSCTVTASNAYGSATATSNSLTVVAAPKALAPRPTPAPPAKFHGVSLRSTRLTTDGKGHVSLTIVCPKATPGGRCAVSIALYGRAGTLPRSAKATRRTATLLAKSNSTVTAGRAKTSKLKLDRAGRRAVRHLPLRVRVRLTARDPAKTIVTRTVSATIRAAKERRRHK